ncbi:MAG: hypothetical protein AB4290_08415 [Spirulina sp.]
MKSRETQVSSGFAVNLERWLLEAFWYSAIARDKRSQTRLNPNFSAVCFPGQSRKLTRARKMLN